MKKTLFYATTLLALFGAKTATAQCPGGQANVTIDVTTDSWGYEAFWDITATGAGCGVGTLYGPYGNTTEIDCNGGGLAVATAGGYADNVTTTETIGCVVIGTCLDINYVDDYGDGGAEFEVFVNGISNSTFVGSGNGGTFNFCVDVPAQYDAAVDAVIHEYTMVPLSQAGNIVGDATAYSNGAGNLTNVVVTLNVLKGAAIVYTQASAPQNITAGNDATVSFAGYTPTSTGTYTVSYTVASTETEEAPADNVFAYVVIVNDTMYARDNGTAAGTIGISAGEDGYLGNSYEITTAKKIVSVSTYMDNTDAAWEGQTLTVEIFNTDGTGMPTTSLGTATTTVTGVGQWQTATFASPISLAAGTYVVAAKEMAALPLQVGRSTGVFTANAFWASWTTQPWFAISNTFSPFMIRANLIDDAAITENELENVNVVPNPATTEVTVSNIEMNSIIEIHNVSGQVVYTTVANNTTVTMPVDQLQNGMYIVKVMNGEKIGTTKFIKK